VSGKWRAYLELLRFPAVFTVIADVMMGYLVARGELQPARLFALTLVASCCLYLGGMVLNDVYDADLDARERPERPIPSDRIRRTTAARLGWILLLGGVGLFYWASVLVDGQAVGISSIFLAGAIWVYDAVAKRTPLAPIVMGICRGLNVALVMGLAAYSLKPAIAPLATPSERAIGMGLALYIAGVTWFARSEARTSSRWQLAAGMISMIAGLIFYAAAPLVNHSRPALVSIGQVGWAILWLAIAGVILRRCALAAANPQPRLVQIAVRGTLRSLIFIDAAIVLGFCGADWAWAILALLVPMLLLERWASTT
jgi:4-hydroxybenzoate polyprenyltransferase